MERMIFMFYEVSSGHGLPRDPFKAIVSPRPIGWISTLSSSGVPNLAPYSFFNAVCDSPPLLMFSSAGLKDSATNAIDSGEFMFNYVTRSLAEKMNLTSGGYPSSENEFDIAGLSMTPGRMVSCPRVSESPASLECRVVHTLNPTGLSGESALYHIIIGEVVGVHIDDSFIVDGRFDVSCASPIMRCGYMDYVGVGEFFEMVRPAGGGGGD